MAVPVVVSPPGPQAQPLVSPRTMVSCDGAARPVQGPCMLSLLLRGAVELSHGLDHSRWAGGWQRLAPYACCNVCISQRMQAAIRACRWQAIGVETNVAWKFLVLNRFEMNFRHPQDGQPNPQRTFESGFVFLTNSRRRFRHSPAICQAQEIKLTERLD